VFESKNSYRLSDFRQATKALGVGIAFTALARRMMSRIVALIALRALGQKCQVGRRLLEGSCGRTIALARYPVAGGTVGYIHFPGVAGVGVSDGLRFDGHVL